jgi:rRNA maturation RNase YbeY
MAEAIRFVKNGIRFRMPDKILVSRWIDKVAKKEQYQIESLDFIFCTDSFVHKLNKDFLNHDYLTDILTFNLNEGRGKKISGDIYISIDRVRENALIFKTTFTQELLRVIIHGVLHLMGYDDKTKVKMTKMRDREDKCLKMFHVKHKAVAGIVRRKGD